MLVELVRYAHTHAVQPAKPPKPPPSTSSASSTLLGADVAPTGDSGTAATTDVSAQVNQVRPYCCVLQAAPS